MSSVRKKDQSEHRFTVLDKVLDLYDYTTTVISNEKIFDRTYKSLIDRIDNEATMIYHYCRCANEDLDARKEDEAQMRIELQLKALDHCKWLKTDIRLAQRKFHIKERLGVKYYIRYMDDFILLHQSKEYLQQCLKEIEILLNKQLMSINPSKTEVRKIKDPITYLGFVYRLTSTGKVIVLADPKKIKHERKKILRMVSLVEKGELKKRDVDRHFKAYKASVRYGNSHNLIYRLNKWYESLWKGRTNNERNHNYEVKNGDRAEEGC